MTKSTFSVGDRIKIDSCSVPDKRGEIIALRHNVGNLQTGSLSFGADVLLPSGNTRFFFLHDIARWNPEAMAAGIGREA